ncbi:hypothetical protein [Salegentibacter sp. Hel_I_6]|uniref:hypothetical protein n=1 Tax=Salegentibacter sp. Hel_I_6 TaxID=1250278 RepID=UPI000569E5D2|nr:hypothetical protein [Salegentibacter sp. Hel_I_6]
MIDYLKIYSKDKELISRLNNNPLLTWSGDREKLSHIEKEAEEGIIKAETNKTYKGIVFCFKEDNLLIYFKPHYYFNDNLHNANDFSVNNFLMVLSEVLEDLQLEDLTDRLFIINIEYGVNVLSPIKIEDLITFIAYHKKNEFRTDAGLIYSKKSQSISSNGKASRYQIIKAYAKGIQFPTHAPHNTLRFEIKSQESRKIKSLGIYSIKDLLNPETFKTLEDDLIGRFDEVLILDSSVDLSKLDHKSRIKLIERLNSHYWYKQQQKTRNTFNNSKKTYFKLLDKTGYNIHHDLRKILISKLDDLKYCANTETPRIIKSCANTDIYIMRNCTINELKRECIFTGRELTIPSEEIKGKSQEEIKIKIFIENYTVALFKEHLEDPEYIIPDGRGKVKHYYGQHVENVIKETFVEVRELFKPYFNKFDFQPGCRDKNYFRSPLGGSVVGWEMQDLLIRFQDSFYLSKKGQSKKRMGYRTRELISC